MHKKRKQNAAYTKTTYKNFSLNDSSCQHTQNHTFTHTYTHIPVNVRISLFLNLCTTAMI